MDAGRIIELCERAGFDVGTIQRGAPNFSSLPQWLRDKLVEWDKGEGTRIAQAADFAPLDPVSVAKEVSEGEGPTDAEALKQQLQAVQEQLKGE